MQIFLRDEIKHILILGAGASVDYGLPTWKELESQIKDKIINDKGDQYNNKKEILDWLNKVGNLKKYKTIDECIKFESVSKDYHNNGHKIENEIFSVIKNIFEEVYTKKDNAWIEILNEKIKNNKEAALEKKIIFINYNYDHVLDDNFLNFNYLPEKYKILNYKERLYELSKVVVDCLCPHGNFLSNINPVRIKKLIKTMKSGNNEFIDAVSCHESEKHQITQDLNKKRILYILGLGGGLEINLNNIEFNCQISEIHVTIKNEYIKKKVMNYLSEKFNIDSTGIKVYRDCNDLINNCFN
jgi:hypothetical protein